MQERWMKNARVVREECKWQIRSAREADKKCKSGGWEMQKWLERSASGRLGGQKYKSGGWGMQEWLERRASGR